MKIEFEEYKNMHYKKNKKPKKVYIDNRTLWDNCTNNEENYQRKW